MNKLMKPSMDPRNQKRWRNLTAEGKMGIPGEEVEDQLRQVLDIFDGRDVLIHCVSGLLSGGLQSFSLPASVGGRVRPWPLRGVGCWMGLDSSRSPWEAWGRLRWVPLAPARSEPQPRAVPDAACGFGLQGEPQGRRTHRHAMDGPV